LFYCFSRGFQKHQKKLFEPSPCRLCFPENSFIENSNAVCSNFFWKKTFF
jgi:hypothetical protein